MATGHYISGIGHSALLAWALIGGLFSRTPEDTINVAEVSIITNEEFAALSAPQPSPEVVDTPPTPVQPEIDDTPPEPPVADTPPEVQQPPAEETPPPAEEAPDVIEAPTPLADVDDTPPETPQPPAEDNPVVLAPPATTASPRPAPRVAPTPVEAPPPDTEVADEVHQETAPDAETQAQEDPEPASAPEEANDRIVTEADEPPSSAPTASARPSARPKRPTPPVETADTSTSDAIDAALADVQAEDNAAPATPAPTGPPLSSGDKEALRVAVSSCWNVGSLSTEALQTTVVVAVTMAQDGKPDSGSIHMLSSSGGSAAAAKQAFEAARRAIIRCSRGGYKLPTEKYSHWREIEMTFNPEKMRIK